MDTVVTSSRRLEADRERVWAVLVDPHGAAALQPGSELLRTWGEEGTVGSGYAVLSRQGPVRVPLDAEVVSARPHEELVVEIRASGRVVATGHYLLDEAAGGGTLLTVSTSTPGLLARLTRRANQRNQDAWLDRLSAHLADG